MASEDSGKRHGEGLKGSAPWAAAGLAAGFGTAAWLIRRKGSDALAGIVAGQLHAATWGPVIAVGLGAAASIACAAIVPLAVLYAVRGRRDNGDNAKRRRDAEEENA